MQAREARRAAEKAARDMMNTRAVAVGELAVAATARETAQDGVTAARIAGDELVAAAKAKAAQLISTAEQKTVELDANYSDVRAEAIAAGWRATELDRLGYRALPRRRPTETTAPGHTAVTEQADVA